MMTREMQAQSQLLRKWMLGNTTSQGADNGIVFISKKPDKLPKEQGSVSAPASSQRIASRTSIRACIRDHQKR